MLAGRFLLPTFLNFGHKSWVFCGLVFARPLQCTRPFQDPTRPFGPRPVLRVAWLVELVVKNEAALFFLARRQDAKVVGIEGTCGWWG